MVVSDQTLGMEIPILIYNGVKVEGPADADNEESADDDSESEPKRKLKPKIDDPALEPICTMNNLYICFCNRLYFPHLFLALQDPPSQPHLR